MQRRSLAVLSFLLSCLGASAQTSSTSDHPTLPAGPGRELMLKTCSKCHEPELASQQQMDAAGWKDLVNQMADNGAQGSDADFAQITDYLAKSFPAK